MKSSIKASKHDHEEAGFTLVELLITLVILAGVTGAVFVSLSASLRSSGNSQRQTRESNDAQIISNYLVRDAQGAGGSNPITGTIDSTVGVSTTSASGCAEPNVSATLVIGFHWFDRTATTKVDRVANYYRLGDQLIRRACIDTPNPNGYKTSLTLGTRIANVTASCDPTCSGLPRSVSLTITGTNDQQAVTPYTYTLVAAVRPDAQTAPTGTNNGQPTPLLVLGGPGTCPGLSLSGNNSLTVSGGVVVNGADGNGNCRAMSVGNNSTYSASSTSVVSGGTCSGCPSGVQTLPASVGDPFAELVPPSHDCGTGSGNPAQIAGVWQPGIYHSAFSTASGLQNFAPGVYVFCGDVTLSSTTVARGTGVLFYVFAGTLRINGGADVQLSAASSPYPNLLIWQDVSNSNGLTFNGGATVNSYNGFVYAPSANVALSGGAGSLVGSVIARSVTLSGNGGSGTWVGPPPPLAVAAPASLPNGSVNVAYPATPMGAAGGVAPYVWSATGLPAGLTMTATGLITGTPTTAGPSTVIVTVTDSAATAANRTYNLTVAAPSLVVSGPASLPNGARNVSYPATTATATGGTQPYLWSATGLGGTGLTMRGSGVISGTPTVTGTLAVTVSVTDALNVTAQRSYSLVIPPVPTIVVLANGGGSLGRADQGDSVTITFSEPMATASFCAGWSGAALNANNQVTATIADGGPTDTLTVTISTCTLNLGTIALNANYVGAAGATFRGSGNPGNRSSVAWNAATNQLTITFGALASGAINSGVVASTPSYTPSGLITSAAGVGIVTTPFAAATATRL